VLVILSRARVVTDGRRFSCRQFNLGQERAFWYDISGKFRP